MSSWNALPGNEIVEKTAAALKANGFEVVIVASAEEARRKAYGLPKSFNSGPSKVLVFNKEVQPGRVKIILMNEDAGF